MFSAVSWHGLFARPQQLATRFADAGARVIFVEPPWTVLSPFKKPELLQTWIQSERLQRVTDHIYRFTPPPALPGGNALPGVNKLNQRVLAASLERCLRRRGWKADLLLTHLPGTADWPWRLPTIYDCVDDHAGFSELSPLWKKDTVLELEDALLKAAFRVFASGDKLLQRCRKLRPDAELVGNGVDVAHFADAKANGQLPSEGPNVGFYGGIGPWVDLELVFGAAALCPHVSFTLIGPLEPGVDISQAPENVRFIGFQPYGELPGWLAGFDVAVIPFEVNEVTLSVNPIKLYEYFAAGKPVIVTDIPELTRWGELVYTARSAAEFAQAIDQAVSEPPELEAKRKAAAMANSWDAKFTQIVTSLGEISNA